jgi:hypothetical protein
MNFGHEKLRARIIKEVPGRKVNNAGSNSRGNFETNVI